MKNKKQLTILKHKHKTNIKQKRLLSTITQKIVINKILNSNVVILSSLSSGNCRQVGKGHIIIILEISNINLFLSYHKFVDYLRMFLHVFPKSP